MSSSCCLDLFNSSTTKSSRFSISEKRNVINVSMRSFIDRFFLFVLSLSLSQQYLFNEQQYFRKYLSSVFFFFFFFFCFNGNQTKSMGEEKKKNGSSAVTLLFQRALSPIHHLLFIRTDAYTRSSMNFYILHLFFFFYSRYADGIKTSNVRERERVGEKRNREVQFDRHYAIIIYIFTK